MTDRPIFIYPEDPENPDSEQRRKADAYHYDVMQIQKLLQTALMKAIFMCLRELGVPIGEYGSVTDEEFYGKLNLTNIRVICAVHHQDPHLSGYYVIKMSPDLVWYNVYRVWFDIETKQVVKQLLPRERSRYIKGIGRSALTIVDEIKEGEKNG